MKQRCTEMDKKQRSDPQDGLLARLPSYLLMRMGFGGLLTMELTYRNKKNVLQDF